MMIGIHTFRRDHTTQVISCNPWSPRLYPYPSLIGKIKSYLELEGKLGTTSCTSTYLLDKKSSIKRRFQVRLIVQSFPFNQTLPIIPTPTAVTTTVTSTQTSAVKPTAITANPTPIPVTVYNLAQSRIQEIPNPPIRKFQEEGPPPPIETIPLRHSSLKLQPLQQPCRPERTLHGQILRRHHIYFRV